jgi:hypothetical protein
VAELSAKIDYSKCGFADIVVLIASSPIKYNPAGRILRCQALSDSMALCASSGNISPASAEFARYLDLNEIDQRFGVCPAISMKRVGNTILRAPRSGQAVPSPRPGLTKNNTGDSWQEFLRVDLNDTEPATQHSRNVTTSSRQIQAKPAKPLQPNEAGKNGRGSKKRIGREYTPAYEQPGCAPLRPGEHSERPASPKRRKSEEDAGGSRVTVHSEAVATSEDEPCRLLPSPAQHLSVSEYAKALSNLLGTSPFPGQPVTNPTPPEWNEHDAAVWQVLDAAAQSFGLGSLHCSDFTPRPVRRILDAALGNPGTGPTSIERPPGATPPTDDMKCAAELVAELSDRRLQERNIECTRGIIQARKEAIDGDVRQRQEELTRTEKVLLALQRLVDVQDSDVENLVQKKEKETSVRRHGCSEALRLRTALSGGIEAVAKVKNECETEVALAREALCQLRQKIEHQEKELAAAKVCIDACLSATA